MKLLELLLLNKSKYTRAFLIENESITNAPVFSELFENQITEDMADTVAKDYFLLDRVAIDEVFGNADELGLNDEDKVLIIGV